MLVHSPPRKTSIVGLVAQPCVAGSTVLKLSRRIDKGSRNWRTCRMMSDQTRPWEQRATGRAACRDCWIRLRASVSRTTRETPAADESEQRSTRGRANLLAAQGDRVLVNELHPPVVVLGSFPRMRASPPVRSTRPLGTTTRRLAARDQRPHRSCIREKQRRRAHCPYPIQLSGALGCGRWTGALLLPVEAAVSGEPRADARSGRQGAPVTGRL